MTIISSETENQQPVTAELITFNFKKLAELSDPKMSEHAINDLSNMLNTLTSEQAMSIHTELWRQKTEIETQTANATAEPISSLQSLVDNQFQQNQSQIESAQDPVEASLVLVRAIQSELLKTQDTLFQETIGQPGSQRQENLTYIN